MARGFVLGKQSTAYFVTVRGTVIQKVLLALLLFLLYAIIVTGIHVYTIELKNLTVLTSTIGIAISFLLGFRVKQSVAKYNEVRTMFGTLKQTIRSMANAVWIQVPVESAQDLVEKKTIVNLLDCFCYALKHYIRKQYSYNKSDMRNCTTFLPKFAGNTNKSKVKKVKTQDPYVASDFKPPTNIPQEILYALTAFSKMALDKHVTMDPVLWQITYEEGLNVLESTVTQLEALRRTPTPVCYVAHLEHVFWIYLLALPFEIFEPLGWWTILVVGVAFLVFIGLINISKDIEHPFGFDDSDLPLDDYCFTIRNELNQLTSNNSSYEESDTWMLSAENFPLSPYSSISAAEWADKSMESAQKILFAIELNKFRQTQSRKYWKPKKENNADQSEQQSDTVIETINQNEQQDGTVKETDNRNGKEPENIELQPRTGENLV